MDAAYVQWAIDVLLRILPQGSEVSISSGDVHVLRIDCPRRGIEIRFRTELDLWKLVNKFIFLAEAVEFLKSHQPSQDKT